MDSGVTSSPTRARIKSPRKRDRDRRELNRSHSQSSLDIQAGVISDRDGRHKLIKLSPHVTNRRLTNNAVSSPSRLSPVTTNVPLPPTASISISSTTAIHGVIKLSALNDPVLYLPRPAFLSLLNSIPTSSSSSTSTSDDSTQVSPRTYFTMQQLWSGMQSYIRERCLYDPADPTVVHCADDPLANVFHRDNFTINDTMFLIRSNVDPLPCVTTSMRSDSSGPASSSSLDNQSLTNHNSRSSARINLTRLMSESSATADDDLHRGEQQLPTAVDSCAKLPTALDGCPKRTGSSRRTRGSSLSIVCHIPSGSGEQPGSYNSCRISCELGSDCSDIESILSIQSKVTAVVKDSTDDLWFLEDTDDEVIERGGEGERSDEDVYYEEYEIASSVDEDVNSASEESDDLSDRSHDRPQEALILIYSESDMEFFADDETSELGDRDEAAVKFFEDFTEEDKWLCPNCSITNRPTHRYCDFCWTLRPDWLPDSDQLNHRLNHSTENSRPLSSSLPSKVNRPSCMTTLPSSCISEINCLPNAATSSTLHACEMNRLSNVNTSSASHSSEMNRHTNSNTSSALQACKVNITRLGDTDTSPVVEFSSSVNSRLINVDIKDDSDAVSSNVVNNASQDQESGFGSLDISQSLDVDETLATIETCVSNKTEESSLISSRYAPLETMQISCQLDDDKLAFPDSELDKKESSDIGMVASEIQSYRYRCKAVNEVLDRDDVCLPPESRTNMAAEIIAKNSELFCVITNARNNFVVPDSPIMGTSSAEFVNKNDAELTRADDMMISVNDSCMSCLSRPKDASIIHGSTGHQACCYECALQLKRRHMPCPICRRHINRVVRNYVV